MSYQGERNITQTSDMREFHAETSRLHANRGESGFPPHNQVSCSWPPGAPVLVTNPVRPEDGQIKSDMVGNTMRSILDVMFQYYCFYCKRCMRQGLRR